MMDMRSVEKIEYGSVSAVRVVPNQGICRKLATRYIAFDTETTGLDPEEDRIVELGAVKFENGLPTDSFRTYVNPGRGISPQASAINHITDEILARAPAETVVYPRLMDFMGDAVNGETLICGHVAAFDMSFLCRTMNRLGLSGRFRYVDTRQMAAKIPELEHHGLAAVAEYYGVSQENPHHAEEDALTSGRILWKMLNQPEGVIYHGF